MSDPDATSRRRRNRLYTIGAILGAVVGVLFFFAAWRILHPADIPFDPARYTAARDLITSGKLRPDPEGIVTLPPELRNLSMTGYAYITPAKGATVLFFPTSNNSGGWFQVFPDGHWLSGHVFDSRLRARARDTEPSPEFYVVGPVLVSGKQRRLLPRVQEWDLVGYESHGDGWFTAAPHD